MIVAAKDAAHFPRVWFGRLASLATMKRAFVSLALIALLALALPAVAFAHDQPETKQSRWVMADWMMDTFFIFSGLAVVAFLAAWKAGHFQELDRVGGIPLLVEEEDYYTPEWALDEEEWADGDA
jgi:protein-S-isoprenylcysteine O-methyltransferase Ste14